MYAGTTLKPLRRFDAWFGAHQKIDRVARTHLNTLLPKHRNFPGREEIVAFEGFDGPDGIKRKTPARGELWHFIDPEDDSDRRIVEILQHNYNELVQALKDANQARAAFEAAWLAHGIVDGLTPAHQYAYEKELVRLRGEGIETRTTPKDKLLIPGETLPKQLKNNWQVWGDKGLISTHLSFEIGVAAVIMPLSLRQAKPTEAELAEAAEAGLSKTFLARVREVAELHMYEEFYKSGWTPRLAQQVGRQLVPRIVNTVTVAWYLAAREAYEI